MQPARPGIAYQGIVLAGLTVLIALSAGAGMVLWSWTIAGSAGDGFVDMVGVAAFISIFGWFFALAAVLVFVLPVLIFLRKMRANQSAPRFLLFGAATGAVAGLILGFPITNGFSSVAYFPLQGATSGVIAAWVWWKLVESRLQESNQ